VRGVGLVFQHYALFRHMTVAENIEFALRVRRMRAAARRQRRQELLQLVALEGYDERYPSQLSGGQQQRVAVARALAHEPAVLLLDEPFGALDAKIRVELRDTVRAVQRRLGMTTILVTHDQEEAFALADRIGVMQMGRLLETGTSGEPVPVSGHALCGAIPRRRQPVPGPHLARWPAIGFGPAGA
jgi:sulfate transport system ATP-binding protein